MGITFVRGELAKAGNLPFSEAVRIGDMVYLSGQLGLEPGKMVLVPGGIEPETVQMMENIGRTLAPLGLTFDHIFKCSVMLADMKQWSDFNKVYVKYFKPDRLPIRSAFGVSGLALDAAVEMECVAYAG